MTMESIMHPEANAVHVDVTGLTRVNDTKPNVRGDTLVAYFNCRVAGFEFMGCKLWRTKAGGFRATPPSLS